MFTREDVSEEILVETEEGRRLYLNYARLVSDSVERPGKKLFGIRVSLRSEGTAPGGGAGVELDSDEVTGLTYSGEQALEWVLRLKENRVTPLCLAEALDIFVTEEDFVQRGDAGMAVTMEENGD